MTNKSGSLDAGRPFFPNATLTVGTRGVSLIQFNILCTTLQKIREVRLRWIMIYSRWSDWSFSTFESRQSRLISNPFSVPKVTLRVWSVVGSCRSGIFYFLFLEWAVTQTRLAQCLALVVDSWLWSMEYGVWSVECGVGTAQVALTFFWFLDREN